MWPRGHSTHKAPATKMTKETKQAIRNASKAFDELRLHRIAVVRGERTSTLAKPEIREAAIEKVRTTATWITTRAFDQLGAGERHVDTVMLSRMTRMKTWADEMTSMSTEDMTDRTKAQLRTLPPKSTRPPP